MRNSLLNPKLDFLQYGIREIVLIADQIKKRDPAFTMIPENIGDPIIKGWTTPQYVKDLLCDAARNKDIVWGYVHSRGLEVDDSTVGEGDKKGPVPVFVKDLGNLAKDFVHKYLSLCEANVAVGRQQARSRALARTPKRCAAPTPC